MKLIRWMCAWGAMLVIGNAQPSFEVATVRHAAGTSASSGQLGNQLMLRGLTLQQLLAFALDVPGDRILGPKWIESERYDITASNPLGTPREVSGPKLVTLLTQRFALKLRHEAKEREIHEITVAPGGIKLTAVEIAVAPPQPGAPVRFSFGPNDPPPSIRDLPANFSMITALARRGATTILAGRQTIAALAKVLEKPLGTPVVDKTELTATYSFDLTFFTPPASSVEEGPVAEPLPRVMQEKLGLILTKTKGPVDFIVIDSGNQEPEEN